MVWFILPLSSFDGTICILIYFILLKKARKSKRCSAGLPANHADGIPPILQDLFPIRLGHGRCIRPSAQTVKNVSVIQAHGKPGGISRANPGKLLRLRNPDRDIQQVALELHQIGIPHWPAVHPQFPDRGAVSLRHRFHNIGDLQGNAVQRGEDLKYASLRNMYTHPEFVQLSADTQDADGNEFKAGTMYGEIVQFYLDQMGCKVTVADACDGWYNPDAAKEFLAAAKEELGDTVSWPIQIDVVYLGSSANNTAQSQAYKQKVEETLGAENVVQGDRSVLITGFLIQGCHYDRRDGEAASAASPPVLFLKRQI